MKENMIINSKDHVHFIKQKDILYCQSDNYTTHIFLIEKKRISTSTSLSVFSKLLDKKIFVRVSQSHIINMMHIDMACKKDKIILLSNGDRIPYTFRLSEWAKTSMDLKETSPDINEEEDSV